MDDPVAQDPTADASPEPDPERPSEVTSGRLLRNTLVNGAANASNALVIAILTPFLLHQLGPEEYGLWVLGLSLTFSSGYLALADLGLPDAAVKFIAEARAVGSQETINRIVSTTVAVFAAAGAVIGGLILLIVPWLVQLFNVEDDLVRTARVLFSLMALEIIIELPATAMRTVIEGLQRYSVLRSLDVGGRILFGVLAVVTVSRGHGVVALAVCTLSVTVIRATATFVVAHRVSPGLKLRPRFVTRRTLKDTLSYGSFIGGLRFLSVIYSQMDRAIIGITISVAAVASYEVVFRIQSIATLVLVMTSSAVLPAAAYNAALSDTNKQRELYLRGTKYAMAICVPVCLASIIYARSLIVAWVGPEYAHLTNAARLFLVFPVIASVNQVGTAMLIGHGRVRRVLMLQVIAVSLNLVLSIALAGPYGITGVIAGTLIGNSIVWIPYIRVNTQTFGVSFGEWARRIILPNLPGTVTQLALALVLALALPEPTRWIPLLICFAASCGINLVTFAGVGLGRGERNHLISRLTGRPEAPIPASSQP